MLNLNTLNTKNKYGLISLNSKKLKQKIYEKKKDNVSNLINFNFSIQRKRPDIDLLKKEEGESFNNFNFKYPLGFFAGCTKFIFRVTFKEYKQGLKPAKFSLLLNQFCLNLEKFITLVQEVLINNFPLEFYEEFFGDKLSDIDFKIHFIIILRTKGIYNTTTKFFILPKGCFISHLKEQLWSTLFSDISYFYSILTYYKGFKSYSSIIFLLILYYVYKLLHYKLTIILNKHKTYDYEERAFESFGNILSLNYDSFKLYCKYNLRGSRYSYFLSARCLDFFMEDDIELNLAEYKNLESFKSTLNSYFDLIQIDEDINSI
jgi:hypothetical protein